MGGCCSVFLRFVFKVLGQKRLSKIEMYTKFVLPVSSLLYHLGLSKEMKSYRNISDVTIGGVNEIVNSAADL